jgi:DNA polymerase III alpha subunit
VWRPAAGDPQGRPAPRAPAAGKRAAGPALFPLPEPPATPLPALPEYGARVRCRLEMELLGFCTSHHPLDFYAARSASQQPIEIAHLDAHVGRHVAVVGWLVTTRRTRTARGEAMRFLSLEDRSGVVEGVLFPDAYRRFGHRLRGAGPYLARGQVTASAGSVGLRIAYLELWEEAGD